MKVYKLIISIAISIFFVFSLVSASTLIDPSQTGFDGQSKSDNYDALLDAMFADGRIVTTIDDSMWVPWFKSASSSQISDLQDGNNCNSGQTIDENHNCMVTDEFSQVGVLVAMGKDETRMKQFFNTVHKIESSYGDLPSWRVYRNGDNIEACNPSINGNCDTASDADARIIIALYTASKNPYFTDEAMKTEYADYATKLSEDMLEYEVDKTCRPTRYGEVCNWLAGGPNVKQGGMASSDYAYTGYYPDAIISMLAAYANTGEVKYLEAAQDFTLNYMQAAQFDGNTFTAPPGKSFKWNIDGSGEPKAECTNTCSPDVWDGFDASRALGMCQAQYYADEMDVELPELENYCKVLGDKHMSDPSSAPLQFYPDGTAVSYQSGYYAQGLQALHQAGVSPSLFEQTLNSALDHYTPSSKTFDNEASFGVYTKAFVVRALGMGIGRDLPAFVEGNYDVVNPPEGNVPDTEPSPEEPIVDPTPEEPTVDPTPEEPIVDPTPEEPANNVEGIAGLTSTCTSNTGDCTPISDVTEGVCRTIKWDTPEGAVQVLACEKGEGYIELYQQEKPDNNGIKACVNTGCVDDNSGFARFKPTQNEPVVDPTPEEPIVDPTPEEPTVDPTPEEPVVKPSPEKPSSKPKPEEPTVDPTPEEPVVDPTPEEPVVDPTPEEPVVEPSPEEPVSDVEGIAGFVSICTSNTGDCTPISDVTEGVCRTVKWNTPAGIVQVLACEKGEGYIELYQQEKPNINGIEACIGEGCVDDNSGFARFKPTQELAVEPNPEEPANDVENVASLSISCSTKDGDCSLLSDEMNGDCRTAKWSSSAGEIQVSACEKDNDRVEVYRQKMPDNIDAKVCFADECVDDVKGFASVSY